MNNTLIEDFSNRGLISQTTNKAELTQHLSTQSRSVYCGFDPTADSLHIGSLVPLLALKRFQLAGHRPIVVIGGATGLIGDPSFKAQERKLNTPDIVKEWSHHIHQQVSRFVDFDCGQYSALLANNYDWTVNLNVLTFLRDIGKHFPVNSMIQKESVKQRLQREDQGISFTEFTYMILQAYDFAELNKRHQCTIQIGGSDQWGNITSGIELTRRLYQKKVFGMTLPLVTKADGTKFGKTESGTIWLEPAKTSPYAFYQFWLNTADADVYTFLRLFTFLSEQETIDIENADQQSTNRPTAQRILAKEVTESVHGKQGLISAERITRALFSSNLTQLTINDLEQLCLDGMPKTDCKQEYTSLVETLVMTGLAPSNRRAREFINNGAVSVNGEQITDIAHTLNKSSVLHGQYHILKRGKKLFHLLRWC